MLRGCPALTYLPDPLCAIQSITEHQDWITAALHLTALLYSILPHRTLTGTCLPLVMESSLLNAGYILSYGSGSLG